ncbi:pollen-specific leucine-rich repeat extensin-like protein 1 [Diachasma alloeum]|uniref:pollen-specific leucine-rich repeat extensin-like protein 1 n=1 Tax=Diachasma alloeum TaxID=454923 RepID=UPI0007384F5A|nr:pollen-specific leucine-rich repeat extensin-like protein 1 [Diachasma alloeum]
MTPRPNADPISAPWFATPVLPSTPVPSPSSEISHYREEVKRRFEELCPYEQRALLDAHKVNIFGSPKVLIDRFVRLEVRKKFGDVAAEWNKEVDSSYIPLSLLGFPTQLWGSSLNQVSPQNRSSETSQIVESSRTNRKREAPRIELPSGEFQVTLSQPRTSTMDLSPSKALEPSVPSYPSQPHLATLTVAGPPNLPLEQTPQDPTEQCPPIPPGPDQSLGNPSSSKENANVKDLKEEVIEDPKLPPQMDQIPPLMSLKIPQPPILDQNRPPCPSKFSDPRPRSNPPTHVPQNSPISVLDPIPPLMSFKIPRPPILDQNPPSMSLKIPRSPVLDPIPPLMSLNIPRPPSLNRSLTIRSLKSPRLFDLNPIPPPENLRIPRPHAVDGKPGKTKSAFHFHLVESRSPQPLGNFRMSPNTSKPLPVTPAIPEKTPSIPERPRRTLNPPGILGISHHVSRFHRMIRRVQKYPLESRKFPGNPQVLLKIPENPNESRPPPKIPQNIPKSHRYHRIQS